jgi:hypothetical protein
MDDEDACDADDERNVADDDAVEAGGVDVSCLDYPPC